MQTALVRLCQSGHDIKFIILLVVLFMLVFQNSHLLAFVSSFANSRIPWIKGLLGHHKIPVACHPFNTIPSFFTLS